MLRALIGIVVLFGLLGDADAGRRGSRHTYVSKKSTSHGSGDGHYRGGHGSSHKGGSYHNANTGNHYRKGK